MGSGGSKKSNSSYKLTYFNARGRGEVARLCFAVAGVKYEDVRIEQADWPALKPKMPLGFMPLLEVDGKPLSQSMAINRLLARRFGLYGETDFEQAKIDEIMDTAADFGPEIIKAIFSQDEAAKAAAIKALTDQFIPFYLEYLEKTLNDNKSGSGYLVGRKLSVADLMVFVVLETLESVVPSSVDKYPKVRDHSIKIGVNSNIARHVANRPKTSF